MSRWSGMVRGQVFGLGGLRFSLRPAEDAGTMIPYTKSKAVGRRLALTIVKRGSREVPFRRQGRPKRLYGPRVGVAVASHDTVRIVVILRESFDPPLRIIATGQKFKETGD